MFIRSVCEYLWHSIQQMFMVTFHYLIGVAVRQAAFGQGIGFVLLSYVGCTGSESSLLSCSHGIGVTYCSHYQDAGVVCPTCKSCIWCIEFSLLSYCCSKVDNL